MAERRAYLVNASLVESGSVLTPPDFRSSPPYDALTPPSPWEGFTGSWPNEERRSCQLSDRRGNTRKGKFDRRRNRCGACQHFKMKASQPSLSEHPTNDALLGVCERHRLKLPPDAFACLYFSPA